MGERWRPAVPLYRFVFRIASRPYGPDQSVTFGHSHPVACRLQPLRLCSCSFSCLCLARIVLRILQGQSENCWPVPRQHNIISLLLFPIYSTSALLYTP